MDDVGQWPGTKSLIIPSPDANLSGRDGRERFYDRAQIIREVRACTACGLRAGCLAPVPYHGPLMAKWAVLGEAPDNTDDHMGKPGTGKASKLLRGMMRDQGLDDGEAVWVNRVACVSVGFNAEGKMRMRAPGAGPLAACAGNVERQIVDAEVRFVLLVGVTALGWLDEALTLSRVHGRIFIKDERWVVMPVHHPMSVIRGKRGGSIARELADDLHTWRKVVEGRADLATLIGTVCSECPGVVAEWVNGVGLCKGCARQRGEDGVKVKVKKRTRKKGLQDEQLWDG